jgi:hypothetical protein
VELKQGQHIPLDYRQNMEMVKQMPILLYGYSKLIFSKKNSAQLPTTEPTKKILFPTLPYPWMSITLTIIQINQIMDASVINPPQWL